MSDVPSLSILEPVKLRSGGGARRRPLVTAIALGRVRARPAPALRARAGVDARGRAARRREAMQRLAALGVRRRRRRGRTGGAFVLEGMGPEANGRSGATLLPEWSNLEDLLDFRQLIEPSDRPDGGARIAAADDGRDPRAR